MALIQTAGYGIGKIGSMFSPKTGEGNSVKKAVLKKTKVRREVIARNKILEKKRLDKRRKIENRRANQTFSRNYFTKRGDRKSQKRKIRCYTQH